MIELPYALLKAGKRKKIWEYLTDFDTLMGTLEAELAELVIEDYEAVWETRSTAEYENYAVWESFFREKSHFLLHDYPRWGSHKVLLQLAMEHADESPVTLAAERWLELEYCDWKWSYLKTRPKVPYISPVLKVMIGHEGNINGVLELKDGKLLSWSKNEHHLRLWSSEGEELAVLKGHEDVVREALELKDGRILSWSNYGDKTCLLYTSPSPRD